MKQDEIQADIVQKALKFYETENRGIAKLVQRFGKCRTTIELWKELYKDSAPLILITYPSNIIEEVWKQECEKWKYYNPNIFYVNFRSLDKYKDFKPNFFCIDEIHEASDYQRNLCHQIMTNDVKIKTLGLSGTVSKETEYSWGLPIICSYTSQEGINDGIISDYSVTVYMVELDNKVKIKNKKGKLLSEKNRYENYSFVIDKMKNNGDNSMHLALARNRLSLSSIGKMNFLKTLLKTLESKRVIIFTGLQEVAESIGIPYFHSKSTTEGFDSFQKGEINHLALVNTGGTGVTYYNLDCVILLNFVGNSETISQQLFRAIKLDYKEKCANLAIICLNEKPEKTKLKQSLDLLDLSKIKYIN